jgi:hypothetical protein
MRAGVKENAETLSRLTIRLVRAGRARVHWHETAVRIDPLSECPVSPCND